MSEEEYNEIKQDIKDIKIQINMIIVCLSLLSLTFIKVRFN
jgi:hypothetical protein